MANIRELCAQLGFNSIAQLGIYPKKYDELKYDATPLLEKSQEFVKAHVARHGYPDLSEAAVLRNLYMDSVPISHKFLNHNRFAEKYWPTGTVERPFRGPKWGKDTDLIEELVAKIIAHKMRNIKKQNAKVEEAQAEPQPEGSSDLLPDDQEGPLSSHVIDLEDFDSNVAGEELTQQTEGKDIIVKEEILNNEYYASILSSVENNDMREPPHERRASRKRRGSSPPWTWTKQLPTPIDKTELIGKHSLRKRAHPEMSIETHGSLEHSSKVRKTSEESPPPKRRPGRRIKRSDRLESHQANTKPPSRSLTPIKSAGSLEFPTLDKVVQGARSSFEREMAQLKKSAAENPNISFHFFGSDPSLGAVPKPYTAVNSSNSFFGTAVEAWMLAGHARPRTTAFTAVSVTWEGAKRPVMIPWHDADGFQGMISAVKKAECKGEVEVEVRCITQL